MRLCRRRFLAPFSQAAPFASRSARAPVASLVSASEAARCSCCISEMARTKPTLHQTTTTILDNVVRPFCVFAFIHKQIAFSALCLSGSLLVTGYSLLVARCSATIRIVTTVVLVLVLIPKLVWWFEKKASKRRKPPS